MESAPLASLMEVLHTFTRPTPTTEILTHSHSIHLKITRLVRRSLLKREACRWARYIVSYYCYIILSTELKEKHNLESSTLGLKKKTFYVTKMKECRKNWFVLFSSWRTPDPFFLPKGFGSLSPPWGPQTPYQPT